MTTAPAPAASPFAGIPISDWVRDATAALLLLVSLALPWSLGSGFYGSQTFAIGRIEVILVTLLSLLSLSITYLARAGVFPVTVTVRSIWVLRLLVNAPYVIVVLVHLVIDAAQGTGLGFAAAFGLAGAVLAAQPREAEVRSLDGRDPVAALWHAVAIGYTLLIGLTVLLALIFSFVTLGSYGGPQVLAALVVTVLFTGASLVIPAIGLVRRSEAWRTLLLGLAAAAAVAVLVDAVTGFALSPLGTESIRAGGYLVVLFLPLAAIAASPGTRLAMTPIADLTRWFTVVSTSLVVAAVLAAAWLVRTVIGLVLVGGYGPTGLYVVTTILLLVIVVVAVIGRSVLRSNPAGSRWTVIGFAGAILLFGIIAIAVNAAITVSVGLAALVLAIGVPAVIAYALLAPASVRTYFASATPVPSASPYVATVSAQPVDESTIISQPVAVDHLEQLAADPAATPEQLFELARDHQRLWPLIAANPVAYDDLLTWLASSGDPSVQAALRARGR